MIDILLLPLTIIYLVVVSALFIYGVNFLYMVGVMWRAQRKPSYAPVLQVFPMVTVQLPIYNELYVAERLIDAVCRFDYPAGCLEIQVLDDSTDETVQIIKLAVSRWQRRGVNIHHYHRHQRTGFKAGALGEGLDRAQGEFIAIFDADFIPPPDFLKRTLPHFFSESETDSRPVAFVQARWGHVNRNYSFFTFLQALAIDAHFMVEQHARYHGGYWFNFNGTAGVWRKTAIQDAGGWKADTLTEDLDLSYRAFLKGWRAVYIRNLEVPAELPVSFHAYRRQQHRWARGSLECAIKLLPKVWASPIPFHMKIQSTLHLTGYGVHLLLFSLTLLYPAILLVSAKYPALTSLFGIALLFNATAFAPTIFFVAAQQQLRQRWWHILPKIMFVTTLGTGMMVNTLRAAWQILSDKTQTFERTPKFGILSPGQKWYGRRYQNRLDPLVFGEVLLALANLVTAVLGVRTGNYLISFYAGLFATGLLYTSYTTISQAIYVQHSQESVKTHVEA